MFIIGITVKYTFVLENNVEIRSFDYSKQDSLFYLSDSNKVQGKIIEKNVDSKRELLDFSGNEKVESKKQEMPIQEKVNINDADLNTLTSLPGIGIKTAEKIIKLRDKKGKFSKIEDLLEVKGIGAKKIVILKNFITIE